MIYHCTGSDVAMQPRGGASAFFSITLVLSVLLATSACTSNRMHRPPPGNIQQEAGYTLAFIEFDDQGELWSPEQRERVVDFIERKNEAEAGVVLIVFAHGWNNNASEKDEQNKKRSLYGFKQFMSQAVVSVKKFYPERQPHLVAVYIGWRGKSAHQPFKGFTFYSRRKAAERIASGPTVSEVLLDLIHTAKENRKSKTIVIGHSFGAMLLERAIAQMLVGEVVTSDDLDALELPIDLVVLLNAAAPALLARQLVEVFARHRIKVYRVDDKGNRVERPLLISITSTADWATRFAYPIGNAFGAVSRRFREYGSDYCSPAASQKEYYKRTAGHVPALHTHIVTATPLPKGAQPAEDVRIDFDPDSGRRTVSFDGKKHSYTIRRSARSFNDTPYWIMQVSGSMMNSHADIFNFDTDQLLRALVRWTGTMLPKTKTVLVRETGVSPIGLTTHPITGELVIADRSRRLYSVPAGSSSTVFIACMQSDPTSIIGVFGGTEAVFVVHNREILKKGQPVKYETVMRRVRLLFSESELETSPPLKLAGSQRFFGATGDPEGQKLYLTTQDAIYVADVAADSPAPQLLTRIQGQMQLRRLVVDTARQRLFALDTAGGRVLLVDLSKSAPQATLAADGLGKASDIDINRRTGMVYIVNAETRQVWQLACKAGGCTKQVFARSNAFKRPFRLEITRDGTVWVADAKASRIFGLDPDGSIRHTIDSLE